MDPIRPFIALIRTLGARRQKASANATSRTGDNDSPAEPEDTPVSATEPFQAPLRIRLQAFPDWDSARARRFFVEQVLITELGVNFTRDPQFAELIDEVSQLIEKNPKNSHRLDQLLRSLAAK